MSTDRDASVKPAERTTERLWAIGGSDAKRAAIDGRPSY